MSSFFSSFKKLFSIVVLIFLYSSSPTLAAPEFSATTAGPTIKGTLSGTSFGDGPFLMFYQTSPYLPLDSGTNPTGLNSIQGFSLSGDTTGFNVDGVGNTLYYVRVVGKVGGVQYVSPTVQVTTGDQARIAPLSYDTPASDCKSIYINSAVLDGSRSDYDISLEYQSADEKTAGFELRKAFPHRGKGTDYIKGIADDGTYNFRLENLTGGKKYYITHVVKSISTGKVVFRQEGAFDSCKGYIAVGSTAALDDFNKRSYRFLAPIEIPSLGIHLTLLPDQDLCKEQEAEGKVPMGSCDNQIGDFINLILRILISAAAIFLVIQIIIKGYQYMVTDIPKFKINAKERVFEAFGGLLLALSAFLILNTINPKLVAGTLNVDSLDIGVEEDNNEIITNDRFTQDKTSRTNRNCKGKIIDVKTGNGSFIDVCDEISGKVELMFSDAKKDGITLSGGGYRTYQEQVALYKSNCGGGSRKCDPATASPGNSMHETGKAFDLKCEGSLITFSTPFKGTSAASTKKCFDWLNKNAYKYGLRNLKKENWHWSVNGR